MRRMIVPVSGAFPFPSVLPRFSRDSTPPIAVCRRVATHQHTAIISRTLTDMIADICLRRICSIHNRQSRQRPRPGKQLHLRKQGAAAGVARHAATDPVRSRDEFEQLGQHGLFHGALGPGTPPHMTETVSVDQFLNENING